MDTSEFVIPQVKVIRGHVSPETAYVVDDYPYGFRLRCRIRYWLESKKGQTRFVSQTTNPKKPGEPWNAPKASTYSDWMVLYLNEDGHVKHHTTGIYLSPEYDARIRLDGTYSQLSDDERGQYNLLRKVSRQYEPPWDQWAEAVAKVQKHIETTGEIPKRGDNGRVCDVYLTDYGYVYAVAEALVYAGTITEDYPRKVDGRTVWACCESAIGPTCKHRTAES